MYVEYGIPQDIDLWMALVEEVRWNFPGLETQEKLNEHRATVLKFMGKRQAICVKEGNVIASVMLFSRGHNMICCLAVSPGYRCCGVALMLMDEGIVFAEHIVILKCEYEENKKRCIKDNRDNERIERGMKNTFNFYDELEYPTIDTTFMSPGQVSQKIIELFFR